MEQLEGNTATLSGWKNKPRELYIVLGILGLIMLSAGLTGPVFPLFLANRSVNPQLIGLIFSLSFLASLLSEFISGWVFDNVNPKLGLLSGTLGTGLAVGAILFVRTEAGFFAAFFFYGLFWIPAFLGSRWYIGTFAPAESKAGSLGMIGLVAAGTNSLGSFLGGWLADSFGLTIPFFVAAGVLVIPGLLMIPFLGALDFTKPQRVRTSVEHAGRLEESLSLPWIKIAHLGLLSTVFFMGFGVINAYLPLLGASAFSADPGEIGLLFGVFGLVRFSAAIPISGLADRFGRRSFVLLGLLSCAASLAGFVLAPDFIWLLISIVFFALAFISFLPASAALLSGMVSEDQQGRAMGMLGAFEDSGMIIGPAIGGALWVSLGERSPFIFTAVAALAAALSWMLWGLRTPGDRA
jgi:MFS family permease